MIKTLICRKQKHMKPHEILTGFRWLMLEADTMISQAEEVSFYPGYSQSLRARAEDIISSCSKIESILDLLPEENERIICRNYYAIGMTEMEIAEQLHMNQSTVNRIRNRAVRKMKK